MRPEPDTIFQQMYYTMLDGQTLLWCCTIFLGLICLLTFWAVMQVKG